MEQEPACPWHAFRGLERRQERTDRFRPLQRHLVHAGIDTCPGPPRMVNISALVRYSKCQTLSQVSRWGPVGRFESYLEVSRQRPILHVTGYDFGDSSHTRLSASQTEDAMVTAKDHREKE